jgi:hypothetical protein
MTELPTRTQIFANCLGPLQTARPALSAALNAIGASRSGGSPDNEDPIAYPLPPTRSGGPAAQATAMPPSTVMTWPVTQLDAVRPAA